jgi:ribosomal protein L24E
VSTCLFVTLFVAAFVAVLSLRRLLNMISHYHRAPRAIAWTPHSHPLSPFGVPTFPHVSTRLFVTFFVAAIVAVLSLRQLFNTISHYHRAPHVIAWTPHPHPLSPFGVPTFPHVSTRLFVTSFLAAFVAVLSLRRLFNTMSHYHRAPRTIAWTPHSILYLTSEFRRFRVCLRTPSLPLPFQHLMLF